MKTIALFILGAVLLLGCTQTPKPAGYCTKNSDCIANYCTSMQCVPKTQGTGSDTNCIGRPDYSCYENAGCGCINNKCAYADQDAIDACVQKLKPSLAARVSTSTPTIDRGPPAPPSDNSQPTVNAITRTPTPQTTGGDELPPLPV